MKNKLDLEINLYQKKGKEIFDLGETIKGFIKVRPQENLNIQEFGYHLIKVNLGSYSKEEEIILTESICLAETLYQHEIYRFPIEFTNHNYESYQGKKAQLFFQVEAIFVDERKWKNKR